MKKNTASREKVVQIQELDLPWVIGGGDTQFPGATGEAPLADEPPGGTGGTSGS
ncbi:MAG TPA: hypothetical protein VGG03_04830 [Thermoanaerobaculia bacterium]|jgi:hypothetical protein